MDPHDKIAEIVDGKEIKNEKKDYAKSTTITKDLERVKDNIKFYNKIQEAPILSKKHDKVIFNYKVLNLNHYIKQQAWPESIFNIDKLLRLNTSASYEWQKRYLTKKRSIGLDVFWVLLIFVIIGIVIAVAWILLPRFI